jgi:hypothetical protein
MRGLAGSRHRWARPYACCRIPHHLPPPCQLRLRSYTAAASALVAVAVDSTRVTCAARAPIRTAKGPRRPPSRFPTSC